MKNHSGQSVFERVKVGLEQAIRFTRGELALRVTTLPAPPPRFAAKDVTALRRRLNMSQLVFARTLNVSHRTVQSWERGRRHPSQAALRLLQLLRDRPETVESVIGAGRRAV